MGAADLAPNPPGLDLAEMLDSGMVPGTPALNPLGPWDRDKAWVPSGLDDADDEADVWEDNQGVWSDYAPETLLVTEPMLWAPYSLWTLGKQEPADEDFRRLSNFELECMVVLTGASRRAIAPARAPEPNDDES